MGSSQRNQQVQQRHVGANLQGLWLKQEKSIMILFLKTRNVLEEHWEATHEKEAGGWGLKTKQKVKAFWVINKWKYRNIF
jgi:hypothetical protein